MPISLPVSPVAPRLEHEIDSGMKHAGTLATLGPGLQQEVRQKGYEAKRDAIMKQEAFEAARSLEESYLQRKMKEQGQSPISPSIALHRPPQCPAEPPAVIRVRVQASTPTNTSQSSG